VIEQVRVLVRQSAPEDVAAHIVKLAGALAAFDRAGET
jgi:hypothetical protein